MTTAAVAFNSRIDVDAISQARSPAQTHPILVGYLFWILGFTGAHRFYFGKPLTGALWFFTGGLFLIGWIIDLFLIPSMAEQANLRYRQGEVDYTLAWCLHLLLGLFGIHRMYMGKWLTGLLFMLTGALLGIGYVYDTLTLNEQIDELNVRAEAHR
jgi:TM2 domain-containing membrane protein YozV